MQYDNGKVFLGGISWDTKVERLKEYFGSFGEVVEAVIMKDQSTGRARGFGFVVFADPSVAERVIKEKHNIDGRMVEAKKAVPRDDQSMLSRNSGSPIHGSPSPGQTRKIFVGGLASTATASDFKKYFDKFGTITDVVVMYDHNTQRPRGFGFITYDSENAVDKVLMQTFHELNGKMVEVKRAIPKDLSPDPSRSLLGGYKYGLSSINSFNNQGFVPSAIGGCGLRMDGGFNPIANGLNGFPPFGSAYGFGMNFEQAPGPGYGDCANFSSNPSYARGMNPCYIGNTNRFLSAVGYDAGNGGNTSFCCSLTRNLWRNGDLNNNTNSASLNAYTESVNGNIGGVNDGNNGLSWASGLATQGGRYNFSNISLISNYETGSFESNHGLGTSGYSRNIGNNVARTSSYGGSNGSFDEGFADLYGGDIGDSIWKLSSSEHDGPSSYDYGLGDASSGGPLRNPEYVGGYGVNNRQQNRGIVT